MKRSDKIIQLQLGRRRQKKHFWTTDKLLQMKYQQKFSVAEYSTSWTVTWDSVTCSSYLIMENKQEKKIAL